MNSLEGWLESKGGGALPVAVVLGGGPNGLSVARSLGRRGVPVLLVDGEEGVAGRSRFVRSVVLRGPSQHPGDWVDLLERVGPQLSKPAVLIPINDTLTSLVARQAATLAGWYRFRVPSTQTVEAIVDKGLQYRRARAVGIPIPRSEFPVTHEDIVRVAACMPYPCVLKPHRSLPGRAVIEHNRKLLVVENPADLVRAFDRYATPDNPFLVQELIPGPDTSLCFYLGFWDEAGSENCWITARKLRQYPAGIGDGSLVRSEHILEVAELSRRLLRAFEYRGVVNVEFKRDARDGIFRLIEINPRTAGFNQLAVSAGVDFPWISYQYLTGDGPAPVTEFRDGVRYVDEARDIQAFLAGRRSGDLTFWSWVSSLVGIQAWAVASLRDPSPLIFQAKQRLTAVASRAGGVAARAARVAITRTALFKCGAGFEG